MSNPATKVTDLFSRFGSMINTVLILSAAAGLFVKYGRDQEAIASSITTISRDVKRLETEADRRTSDRKERDGVHNLRLSSVEKTAEADGRKVEQVLYRVTVLEQGRQSDAAAIKEIGNKVNELAGDMKVVRELLQRQAAQGD